MAESGTGRASWGSQPSTRTICIPATVPKVSLSRIISAPAKRAVPDTRCWADSSLTALVSIRPGISTISEATITVLKAIGSMKVATTAASRVATRAAMASRASFRRGRSLASTAMAPITSPIRPAVSTPGRAAPSRAATAPAERPKLSAASTRARAGSGRSSARSAATPAARSWRPSSTSSVIASVAASLARFCSPGSRRMTRVMPFCWPRTGSAKLRIMPVGFDQISRSRPSRLATPSTAASRRWAVVP